MLERATSERQLGSRGGPPMDVTQARSIPRLTPNKVANLYSSINGSRSAVRISPASTATSARARAAVTGSGCRRHTLRPSLSEADIAAMKSTNPMRPSRSHKSSTMSWAYEIVCTW